MDPYFKKGFGSGFGVNIKIQTPIKSNFSRNIDEPNLKKQNKKDLDYIEVSILLKEKSSRLILLGCTGLDFFSRGSDPILSQLRPDP